MPAVNALRTVGFRDGMKKIYDILADRRVAQSRFAATGHSIFSICKGSSPDWAVAALYGFGGKIIDPSGSILRSGLMASSASTFHRADRVGALLIRTSAYEQNIR